MLADEDIRTPWRVHSLLSRSASVLTRQCFDLTENEKPPEIVGPPEVLDFESTDG